MKRYIVIFCTLLLMGCTPCIVLSQVPPQTLQAGPGCQAPLPDYTLKVTATDNCGGTPVIKQTPLPGTMLTSANPSVTVTLTATDQAGNVSDPMLVPVLLIDTVKPILSWPVGQANMTEQDVVNLYENWVAAVKVHGIAKWVYDRTWTQGLVFAESYTDSCGVVHPLYVEDNLKYFQNVIKLTDEEYNQYVSYVTNK